MTDSTKSQIDTLKFEANSYKKLGDYAKAENCILKGLELKVNDNVLKHELAKIYFKSLNSLVEITEAHF